MKLKGSKTEQCLREAFIRELKARAYYAYAAQMAREAGQHQIADLFLATAKNEAEHAEHEHRFLEGACSIERCLQAAVEREREEAEELYPRAADMAQSEGFEQIADFFSEMSRIERQHEQNFRRMAEALQSGEPLQGRTVRYSAIDMAQIMLPSQTNAAGFVHGGELMKLMDNAAYVVATRHARSNAVTAMAEEIHFRTRVQVGDLVLVRAKLTFAGRSSMEVQIRVEVEELIAGTRREALTAHYVMVALDEQGRPKPVPALIVTTEQERQLYREGRQRYEARRK